MQLYLPEYVIIVKILINETIIHQCMRSVNNDEMCTRERERESERERER